MLGFRRAISLVAAVAAIAALTSPATAQTSAPAVAYTGPSAGALAVAVRERIALFSRERGLGLVDLARPAPPRPRARALLAAGIESYHAFRYTRALETLETAVAEVEASGAAGLERRELADLFLYRALSATETGDAETARDNLVRAAVVYPSYPIDKARFRPSLVTAYERARDAVLAVAAAEVELGFPDDCAVYLDGGQTSPTATHNLRPGHHLIRARCPGSEPFAASPTFAAGRQTYRPPVRPIVDPTTRALAETAPAPRVIWVALKAAGDVEVALLDRATRRATRRWKLHLDSAADTKKLDAILASVIDREFAAPAPDPVVIERTRAVPLVKRPWFWVAVGAVAVGAIAVPLALTRGDDGAAGWGVSLDPGASR